MAHESHKKLISLFFLIAFTVFFPVVMPAHAIFSGPSEINVSIRKLNGIKVGSPVVADGRLVGTVLEINSAPASSTGDNYKKRKAEDMGPTYKLVLEIAKPHREKLRKGTIALIASPLSSETKLPETVLELLTPCNIQKDMLANGASITGFSSFEEFWSSPAFDREIERESQIAQD